jgi:hypothetical protein
MLNENNEVVFPYQVNTIMPILGLSCGTIMVPSTVKLTKEDVSLCIKKAPTFRRFSSNKLVKVTPSTIDRLHNEVFMTEEEYEAFLVKQGDNRGKVNSVEEAPAPVVEEKVEEPVKEEAPEPVIEEPEVQEEEPVVEETKVEEPVVEEPVEEAETEESAQTEEEVEEATVEDDVNDEGISEEVTDEETLEEESEEPKQQNNNRYKNKKKHNR